VDFQVAFDSLSRSAVSACEFAVRTGRKIVLI